MSKKASKKQAVTAASAVVKIKHDPVKLKQLSPHPIGDAKYFGFEPLYEVQPKEFRTSALCKSLNWYTRFFDRKTAKTLMVQYLELSDRHVDAKLVHKVDEADFRITLCWLARLHLRGLILTEDEAVRLEKDIQRLLAIAKLIQQAKVDSPASASNSPNVQERMRAKAAEAGGELEGLLDTYIASGAKANHNLKPIDELSKKNVMAQHISPLVEAWKKKEDEFTEVLKGKDAQLVEGYNRFTRTQMKNLLSFTGTVLSDLNAYISVKKANKAPRKRKVIPVEKIVRRLKHVMVFKDPANKLDLVGVSPVKLHGASEAFVYDTRRRKMHHYVADAYSKALTVKGNTVLGFDTKESEIKMFRKPALQIKEIMGSRPNARKFYKEVRAVSTTPKGRFNAHMIILRCF